MNVKIKDAKAEKVHEKIMKLENEQLRLIGKDVFAIDKNGWTNKEKWWKLNDEINELERN